jgi:hypothetical protein
MSAHPSPGSGHRFGRVTHVVGVDAAHDPADVGLLCAEGIVFEADGVADLGQWHLGAVLFRGLTRPLDRKGVRVHNIVMIGPARQPDRSSRSQI